MLRFLKNLIMIAVFISPFTLQARTTDKVEETQLAEWQMIRAVADQDLIIVDKKIPQGIVGSDEEKSFSVVERAERIRSLDASLKIFTPTEQAQINRWADLYRNSINEFYTGRNEAVKTMQVRFSQLDSTETLSASVDYVVRSETFFSSEYFKGGADLTHIKAETSMSPLRGIFGLGSERVNYWPTLHDKATDLNTLRISAMIDPGGTVQAIEVMARDADKVAAQDKNSGWEPYVFEKRWGRWFPSNNVKGMAIESFCIRCHVGADGRFSPYPRNVQDALTFKKIGYLNDIVIQDIMSFK